MSKISVMIAMPVVRMVDIETAESIFKTLLFRFPFPIYWKHQKGQYLDKNKCDLIEEAKRMGVSHIMQIDNDVIFHPLAIETLVGHKKMIVGANYNFKTLSLPDQSFYGHIPMVTMFGKDNKPFRPALNALPKELFSCPTIPGGFLLIDMQVFEKIDKPYFSAHYLENGEFETEDSYFCNKARAAGFDIWCDPILNVFHVGLFLY